MVDSIHLTPEFYSLRLLFTVRQKKNGRNNKLNVVEQHRFSHEHLQTMPKETKSVIYLFCFVPYFVVIHKI